MASNIVNILEEDVERMYYEDHMTQQAIADYYGVNRMVIRYRLHPEMKEETNKRSRQWQIEHPERMKEIKDKFNLEHPDYMKEYLKEYCQGEDYKDNLKRRMKKYSHTDKGKAWMRRVNSKRIQLGSIELNKPFPDSEGHHIDEEHIIHIPYDLHHSIHHNVWTGQGMEAINEIAFGYITEEVFDKLMEEVSK